MLFDGTILVSGIDIFEAEDHIQLAIQPAIAMPVGPGQAIPIPLGIARVPLSKKTALEKARALLEAAEKLPDEKPSDLIVAQSMEDVDNLAKQDQQFKQGQK